MRWPTGGQAQHHIEAFEDLPRDGGGRAIVADPGAGLLVGSSHYMQALRARLARVASSDSDVLLRGETGTGKELAAASIHASAGGAARPWVRVNMAAIPADLAIFKGEYSLGSVRYCRE